MEKDAEMVVWEEVHTLGSELGGWRTELSSRAVGESHLVKEGRSCDVGAFW